MEKKQNITKIFGLRDEKIKDYLRSHPDVAERLANTLISLESQRKKDNKSASAIGALGLHVHRIPDKEFFHQPKHLIVFTLLFILILIFTVTFLASLFYNI
ncbi:hypothetical protein IID23_00265 [Patescibacteria group bacterium]|nr:hypothetical protein [Patescibacteria group bacterium]